MEKREKILADFGKRFESMGTSVRIPPVESFQSKRSFEQFAFEMRSRLRDLEGLSSVLESVKVHLEQMTLEFVETA